MRERSRRSRRKRKRKRRKKRRKRRRRYRKGKIYLLKTFTTRTFLLTFFVCHISASASISIELSESGLTV